MIRKGLIINTSNHTIEKECDYDDTRIEGMYVKVGKDLIPAAYVFPIENKSLILQALKELKDAKQAYDDVVSHIYYKRFPKLR